MQRHSLDERQRLVVDHGTGPMLVLGGPGTGKTTVLEERFVRLATSQGMTSDRILFLVPNRAQKLALQRRLTQRLLFDEGLDALIDVPVYTWHGLAYHLVSRNYDRLAYSEPPVLLTSPEQWAEVRDDLNNEEPGNWPHHGQLLKNRGFVDEVVDFIIRCEQRLLDDPELQAIVEARPAYADLVRFFKSHRERMRARSRVDYPTLLRDAVDLIANHDDVRESLHRRFSHVLVDDGQELAFVQQRLLRFLTSFPDGGADRRSAVVAADPDSAIEHFRGADPAWLGRFGADFGPHEEVVLSTSYRLGPDLYQRVGPFIGKNGDSLHRPGACVGSTTLEARRYQNLAGEVEAVARALRTEHLDHGVAYDDMAILLTSPRSMLPALERALDEVEVPFSISAPDRPLEREGVVHMFTELAHYAFGRSDDDRLAELLRSPMIGLSSADVLELQRAAQAEKTSLSDYVDAAPPGTEHLLELRTSLRTDRQAPADESFWHVWTTSTYYAGLRRQSHEDLSNAANRDLDALVAFSRSLGRFVERRRGRGTLEQYIESISRADFGADPWLPPERRGAGVEVLSFHSAKGREWDVVAVCGTIEGAIPKGRRAQGLFDPYFLDESDAMQRLERNEAEDRRVFYVALTRARRRCILTTSPGPSRKGTPSRYVAEVWGEIPEPTRETESSPLTFSEAAAAARRILSDPHAPVPDRLACLATINAICEADPSCRAAQPSEWWWRWDWTEGLVSINDQSYHESEMDLKKLRTSYTRLSDYDNCPLKYLFAQVIGLDPEVTHNLHFGGWIHQIIEDCEKEPDDRAKAQGRRLLNNREEAFGRFEELFDPSVFPHEAIARQFHYDGRVMLDNYMNHLRQYGTAAMTEHTFMLDVDGNVIKGRIDRVEVKPNGKTFISDYKTSRRPAHYDEAKNSLQLAIYYKAAKEDEELAALGEPGGMQLLYPFVVANNKIAARCQQPEQAEEVLQRLPALMEGVLEEDFSPSPEADCTWCKFKPICPLWPQGRELQP